MHRCAGSVAGCDGGRGGDGMEMRVVLFLDAVCPDVNEVEQWPVCEQWVPHVLVRLNLVGASSFKRKSSMVCDQAGYYLRERGSLR